MDWLKIFENTASSLVGIDAAYFALAALGLNIQFGYTGLLNFGQAAFMACGAYGIGMTSQYFNVSMWYGIPIALAFVVILSLLVGIPTLRLRADYLAIVTIATAEIVRLFVRSVRFKRFFGGSDGINSFSTQFRELSPFNPSKQYGIRPFQYSGYTIWTLIVAWSLVCVFGIVVFYLMRSPWGRVLKAIREDEDAVRSLGKNVYSYKMQALVMGGVIGMFSGMVFALDRGSVQPDNYSRDVTFYILTALVLGGVAKVSGSIVGPMIFWGLYVFSDNTLRELTKDGGISFFGIGILQKSEVGPVNYMLIGIGLMLLMTFRPQGIFGNRKEMALDGR